MPQNLWDRLSRGAANGLSKLTTGVGVDAARLMPQIPPHGAPPLPTPPRPHGPWLPKGPSAFGQRIAGTLPELGPLPDPRTFVPEGPLPAGIRKTMPSLLSKGSALVGKAALPLAAIDASYELYKAENDPSSPFAQRQKALQTEAQGDWNRGEHARAVGTTLRHAPGLIGEAVYTGTHARDLAKGVGGFLGGLFGTARGAPAVAQAAAAPAAESKLKAASRGHGVSPNLERMPVGGMLGATGAGDAEQQLTIGQFAKLMNAIPAQAQIAAMQGQGPTGPKDGKDLAFYRNVQLLDQMIEDTRNNPQFSPQEKAERIIGLQAKYASLVGGGDPLAALYQMMDTNREE